MKALNRQETANLMYSLLLPKITKRIEEFESDDENSEAEVEAYKAGMSMCCLLIADALKTMDIVARRRDS